MMPQGRFSIVSLLAGIGLLLLGSGLINTLLSLRAAAERYPDWLIGLIMAAYFAGFSLGTFYCPHLINRVGHIRAFAVFAALGAGLIALHAFLVHPVTWLIARLVFGGCMVGVYMVVESWLNSRTSNDQRGHVFAVYSIVTLGALAAGQFLLLAGDTTTMELFALAAALFSISLIPIALTNIAEPAPVHVSRMDLKGLYAVAPLALIASLLSGLAGGAFLALGPLFIRDLGRLDGAVAMFIASAIAGGALFQWPIGRWSDRIDRRRVMGLIALGAFLAAGAMLGVRERSLGLLLCFTLLYGGLAFSIYPLSVAHANDKTDIGADSVGIAASLLLAYGIGATAGPLLAGVAMQVSGARALMGYLIICWLILVVAVLRSLSQTAPVAREDKEAFILTARTTPVALEAQIEAQQTIHEGSTRQP